MGSANGKINIADIINKRKNKNSGAEQQRIIEQQRIAEQQRIEINQIIADNTRKRALKMEEQKRILDSENQAAQRLYDLRDIDTRRLNKTEKTPITITDANAAEINKTLANVLNNLKPNPIPIYQVSLGMDTQTNKPNRGIKFVGVIPVRDAKQSMGLQPVSIFMLPDSRKEPITNDRNGNRVFRFTGNKKHYIHYTNMLRGINHSWSMTLYFNVDSLSNRDQSKRVILQSSDINELDVYITNSGKLVASVFNSDALKKEVQLVHNSGYIGISYNSPQRELQIQINDSEPFIFKNIMLEMTSIIFGRAAAPSVSVLPSPFGPGYLGAIALYPQYYSLEQLASLAGFVAPPKPKEASKESPDTETADETKLDTEPDADPESVDIPEISDELTLKNIVVTDPVTGENISVPTDQVGKDTVDKIYRQYNFEVPILAAQSSESQIETFIANDSNFKLKHAPCVSSVTSNHLNYKPC